MKHVFCFSFIQAKDFNELLFYLFLEKHQGQRTGKQNQTICFQRLGQRAVASRKRGPNTVVKLQTSCNVLGFWDRIWIPLVQLATSSHS